MYAVTAVLCALLHVGWTVLPYGSDKCVRVNDRDSESSVICKVRTLDGDGSSISSVRPETSRLTIECNHLLLFESSLRAHYFSPVM